MPDDYIPFARGYATVIGKVRQEAPISELLISAAAWTAPPTKLI